MSKVSIIGIGCLCFGLAGCIEKVDNEALQAELIELETELNELRNRKRALYNEISSKKKAMQNFQYKRNKEADLRLEFDPVEEYVNSLKVADEHLATQLEIWRKATRESMKGRPLPSFQTTSGIDVANGIIVEVSDEAVVVKTDSGERSFEWIDLPEKLRLALVHEPTVTAQARISNF